MTTFTALPGDAAAILSYGKTYESVAERILAVATSIDSLVSSEQSMGQSVDQLKENAKSTAAAIRKAQPRYHTTALALVEFSVDLTDAQHKATAAISAANGANNELGGLNYRRDRREEDRLDAVMASESQDELDRIQHDIRHLDSQIDEVERTVSHAEQSYNEAVADRERAIVEAIGRIQPALDELNDGVLDFVRNAFESLVAFVEAIAEWVGTILKALIDALLELIVALIIAIVVVILVIVLAALLLAIVSAVLFVIGPFIIAALVLILNAAALLIIRSVIRETLTPTPPVIRVADEDMLNVYKRRDMVWDADENHPEGNYENIFNNNNEIDRLGGSNETDIEIVGIYNDATPPKLVGYRVVLPSTQDWEELGPLFGGDFTGDQGALNDLGSNVGLMIMPLGTYGPYERAVMVAIAEQMKLDGVTDPKSVPLMMTGFSQGGILAGRMAANPFSPFNITAVVTAGSCIDDFPIPPSVSVLSLQHPDDPVPWGDGQPGTNSPLGHNAAPFNPNQITVTAAKEEGSDAHGATSYAETAYEQFDQSTNQHVKDIKELQSMFFSDNEHVSIYATHE